MGLNPSKGNMYSFIDKTWNTIKGACYHDCSFCYMKVWGKLKPIRLDEKEFKTDLKSGHFIFVGSSNDMFAEQVPEAWINRTLDHCRKFDNRYFFQSKNPRRMMDFDLPEGSVVCTTMETNRVYPDIMQHSPDPVERARAMELLKITGYTTYVTVEPIMDFDMDELLLLLHIGGPKQVNIGADSCRHSLPEPSSEKIRELISELSKFTKVHEKPNLKRLLKG